MRKWTLIVNYPRVSGVSAFSSHRFDFSFLFSPSLSETHKGSCFLSSSILPAPLFRRRVPFLFSPYNTCLLSLSSLLLTSLPMPDYPPVRRNIPSPPGPAAGKITKKPGAPKAKGAVRAKSGCYTCRIRRKVRFFVSHCHIQNRSPFAEM